MRKAKGFIQGNAPLLVTVLVCICSVAIIYSNSLNGDFVFDDTVITDNPAIRISALDSGAIFNSLELKRPVAFMTFAINYYFHGYDVKGYHAVNIAIHMVNSVLIFFLFTKLLSIAGYKDGWEKRWLPVLSACLWAVNPVHVQSVTYIVQRMNSLATMFYIVSFLSYLSARTSNRQKRRILYFILTVVAGTLAVLSKEIAITLPVMILLFEWVFFREADIGILKKYLWPTLLLLILLPVTCYFFVQHFYSDFITAEYSKYTFTMFERCLTEPRVVIYYIGLLLFPHPSRLNLDYDFPVSHSFFMPFTTIIAIFLVGALIFTAFYLIISNKKNKPIKQLTGFSILWYFGNLFIESSFIPLDLVFEHRTYLPSVLLVFILLLWLSRVFKKRTPVVIITISFIVICSYWTFNRNLDWQTEKKIWLDASKKSPEKARPYYNLGTCYEDEKDYQTAYKYYLKAIEKDPGYYRAYVNIGMYYYRRGDYQKSFDYFTKITALKPDDAEINARMGAVLVKLKRYEAAFKLLSGVLKKIPNHSLANANIAELYMEQGQFEKALGHYNLVIKTEPGSALNYYNRGAVYKGMGNIDLAVNDLKKAISLDPELALPYIMMAKIYASDTDINTAVIFLEKALKTAPDSVEANELMGHFLLKEQDYKGAIHHFEHVLETEPNNFKIYMNLGQIYLKKGSVFGLLINLMTAYQIQPDNQEVKQYYLSVNNAWKKSPAIERIKHVIKYMKKHQQDKLGFIELGKLYYATGQYQKSIESWQKILILEPENFTVMNNLAVSYMAKQLFTDAAEIYTQMLKLQPGNQIVLYNLGCAYSASGDFDKSVSALNKAIDMGFSDLRGMKNDPDLSSLMKSSIGKRFLTKLGNK